MHGVALDTDGLQREFPALSLLVAHGSRARGDAHAQSDYDYAYSADPGLDLLELRSALVRRLGVDAVDLADLARAGAVLRYAAARDGRPLIERDPGAFERFANTAVRFWLDAGPVIRASHAALLEQLDSTTLDLDVIAERVAAVERHLTRVAEKLPAAPAELQPSTDASDAVVLHLWQAVQIVIDLGVSLCIRLNLGAPASYADAFDRLAKAGQLDTALAQRLAKAAGFRNLVAHAYESVDMQRVYDAARNGPADLRAFLARVRDLSGGRGVATGKA